MLICNQINTRLLVVTITDITNWHKKIKTTILLCLLVMWVLVRTNSQICILVANKQVTLVFSYYQPKQVLFNNILTIDLNQVKILLL